MSPSVLDKRYEDDPEALTSLEGLKNNGFIDLVLSALTKEEIGRSLSALHLFLLANSVARMDSPLIDRSVYNCISPSAVILPNGEIKFEESYIIVVSCQTTFCCARIVKGEIAIESYQRKVDQEEVVKILERDGVQTLDQEKNLNWTKVA